MIEWLLIGGPEHGRWRLASAKPYAVFKTHEMIDYAVTGMHWNGKDYGDATVRVSVATPPRPVLYYPERIELPGWRVRLTAYVEAGISAGAHAPAVGSVLPGSTAGVPREVELVCRWCYGRPMDGMDVCSQVTCITNMVSVAALDGLTADDADWPGDRP
jgi:hypothetical protein